MPLAALIRPDPLKRVTRVQFIAWADQYIEPTTALGCSAIELYSARCSVLHTYGTESDLSREGKARPIVYEWSAGPPANTATSLPAGALVVRVEDLVKAFRDAVKRFLEPADSNPTLKSLIEENLHTMLCYKPWPMLIAYQVAPSAKQDYEVILRLTTALAMFI
jgi:hypothetical protein